MEWYKCRPRKLLDACEGLGTAALVATYRTIIDRIYECDGPVSSDAASIGRYAGLRPSHAAKAIAELIQLGKIFKTDDGKLFNRFADSELGERTAISEKRAQAGAKGGRSRVHGGANRDQSGNNAQLQSGKSAENGGSGQANASTRAQDKKERREESPPTPHELEPDQDGQMPASDLPLGADERAELARSVAAVAERTEIPEGMVARLTGEIMRRARMTAPPIDLVLVESWLANGIAEDLILEAVTRMTGGAKSAVRAFRYFDAEIRRLHDAKAASEDAEVAEFRRIAARAKEP